MGSIFIFRSWVCKADDKGSLHGHLVESLETHENLTLSTKLAEDLAEKLTVSESTQAPMTVNFEGGNLELRSESYPPRSIVQVLSRTTQVLFQSDSRT
jgi:hypothetical protein